jgi:hypothetical protein
MEENKHRGGFEQTDANVFAVGKFAVALVLITILAMGLVFGVFSYLKNMEGGEAKDIEPTKVFPEPRLQKTPIPDLQEVREAENKVLTTYGWVDRQKGVVRIPIAQAMDLLVKKGIPVRTSAPSAAEGISEPTESGLGAKMQQVGGPLGAGK